ncbi:hypothetical protein J6590_071859 [Homalodisca vitripennis]|nr:hypothetical protein J6590_071859 [Homalodisca vitripennis]
MGDAWLSDMLVLASEKDILQSIPNSEIIDKFGISSENRKKLLLYKGHQGNGRVAIIAMVFLPLIPTHYYHGSPGREAPAPTVGQPVSIIPPLCLLRNRFPAN